MKKVFGVESFQKRNFLIMEFEEKKAETIVLKIYEKVVFTKAK